jgi:uncharacterized protein (TIGR02391 family)
MRELYLIPWDGQHCRLTRRGKELARALAAGTLTLQSRPLTEDMLPDSMRVALSNYHSENYDAAVFEAMKAVEITVRAGAGLAANDIGAPLMRKAFNADSGALTDLRTERAERQGMGDLFAGAMGVFRNATGHRPVGLSAQQAWDALILAAQLIRIVEERLTAASTAP